MRTGDVPMIFTRIAESLHVVPESWDQVRSGHSSNRLSANAR